jgi:hypothetical protein
MSFIATSSGLTRPSSGNYQLEEITTLHGLTRQYYHSHFPHAICIYGVHVVFLVRGFLWSGVCPLS